MRSGPSISEAPQAPQGLPSSSSLAPSALGCHSLGRLLRRLSQLAALGERPNGFGCPAAHLWRHTLPVMHCIEERDINDHG